MSEVKAEPSEEELAAIMAAVEVVWPRPAAGPLQPDAPPPWRFAGRWWARPVTVRRDRPWITQGR